MKTRHRLSGELVALRRDLRGTTLRSIGASVIAFAILGQFAANASTLSTEVIVSVPDQALALVDHGRLVARYRISTSKFGTGDSAGSYRTPLGTLFISAKFGDNLPAGAVIKNRIPTGEVVDVNAPGRDAIVARVIWLRGMEAQNRGARDRCIYIHGTPEELRIGKPVSFGCIRMRSRDVIDLYGRVHIGVHVTITLHKIDNFIQPEEPGLLARSD
jgi:lipoprotein-anchoring transpeptidase ErfK/SrfK